MARQNERMQLLIRGEQQGVLRPEHVKELAALRATSTAGTTTAPDKKALTDASDRSSAAGKTLRLYDSVAPAIERFNPGPLKGSVYDALMPNDGEGFWGGVGSTLGAPLRALLPQQDKDDYQRINAAQSERVALRQMEQKGPQTDKDAAMYRQADLSPTRTKAVNRDIIARGRTESHLVKQKAALLNKWVAQYGSPSAPNHNGFTFQQASDWLEQNYAKQQRPAAPPSTRRANDGWSVQEVK